MKLPMVALVSLVACGSSQKTTESEPVDTEVGQGQSESSAEDRAAVVRFDDCPDDLGPLVGKIVTLVGVQTRTKVPTVCGVDVDGAYELSDQRVEVTGRLERFDIEPRGPDEPIAATRGPGRYHRIVESGTGQLAKPRPVPVPPTTSP